MFCVTKTRRHQVDVLGVVLVEVAVDIAVAVVLHYQIARVN
jgi:hypothetical protein